eukprot:scaffold7616_cov334-Pinguiococcus_pyrenoidosus.AAC.2
MRQSTAFIRQSQYPIIGLQVGRVLHAVEFFLTRLRRVKRVDSHGRGVPILSGFPIGRDAVLNHKDGAKSQGNRLDHPEAERGEEDLRRLITRST